MKKNLADIATKIREEHAAYEAAVADSVARARTIGQLLIEAKSQLNHGDFRPWIEKHVGLGYTTAHRFMTIAANWKKVKSSRVKTVNHAHDVARGMEPVCDEQRTYSLGRMLDALEEKVASLVLEHPEIADIVDAIHEWKQRLAAINGLKKVAGPRKFPADLVEKVRKAYSHGYKISEITKQLQENGNDVSYEWVRHVCSGRLRQSS